MSNLLLIFITCVLTSLFYWQVVRPVLIQALRYRLFARRDKLRLLAIEGIEDRESFAYNYLESFICKTISFIPAMSLAAFMFYALRSKVGEQPDSLRFKGEASGRLIDIRNNATMDGIIMMMVNSPILVVFASLVAFIFWVSGKISRIMVIRRAENFVDDLDGFSSNGARLNPA
jgi:hypothetical protein